MFTYIVFNKRELIVKIKKNNKSTILVGRVNILCIFAQAGMTKYHRWGGLNNRHLFFTVLEVGKSGFTMPVWSDSGESSLLTYS